MYYGHIKYDHAIFYNNNNIMLWWHWRKIFLEYYIYCMCSSLIDAEYRRPVFHKIILLKAWSLVKKNIYKVGT